MKKQNEEIDYSQKLGRSRQAVKAAAMFNLITLLITLPVICLFSLYDTNLAEDIFLALLVTVTFTATLVNVTFSMFYVLNNQSGEKTE